MIKGYKFIINEEERKRIISLHETHTSKQYLLKDKSESLQTDTKVEDDVDSIEN
jgi:hypothetical protein